jgi:8-oxo-dGTP pyrophosphatase MutT (NUDIX family)
MKQHIYPVAVKIRNTNLRHCFKNLFSHMQLSTAGLLVIQNRQLLLAYSLNKGCFYLPGGKIDPHETAPEALCREIAEELNVSLLPRELSYYCHITAPAYGEKEGVLMEQECFFVNDTISPRASAEIGELRYFTLSEYLQQRKKAPGAIMILKKLKENNLID